MQKDCNYQMRKYKRVTENFYGERYPGYKMPPKLCERIGCISPADVICTARHANWYLCNECAEAEGVEVIMAVRR